MTAEQISDMWCAECGMTMEKPGEYHPYAACLMFKACHSSTTVRANLSAVVEYGRQQERSASTRGEKHDNSGGI